MPEIVVEDGIRERTTELLARQPLARIVAVVLGVLVVAAAVGRARSSAAAVAPPAVATSPAPAASTPPTTTLFVHVAGAVRRPGLYELVTGARVADAIAAAGGARPGAKPDMLNLAEPLVDGVRIEVPRAGTELSSPTSSSTPGPTTVNLNTADQVALETIPGIGPVTATAILEYRASIGRFTTIDQLLEVSGIGPATLGSLRDYVTI